MLQLTHLKFKVLNFSFKYFIDGSKVSSSVINESSKSPPQNLDICNNETQKTLDLDIKLLEKNRDVQKRYIKLNSKFDYCLIVYFCQQFFNFKYN